MRGGFRQRLLAERRLPPEQLWAISEGELDRPLKEGINIAHEACDRWAGDRARLALIVRNPDGGSERWTFAELSRRVDADGGGARGWAWSGQPGGGAADPSDRGLDRGPRGLAGRPRLPAAVRRLRRRCAGAAAGRRRARGRSRQPPLSRRLEAARELLDSDPAVIAVSGPRGRGLLPGDRSFWAELKRRAPSSRRSPPPRTSRQRCSSPAAPRARPRAASCPTP